MSIKTIVTLFADRREAVRAVRELVAHGISKESISFVSRAAPTDVHRIHLPLDDQSEQPSQAQRPGEDIDVPHPTHAVGATLGIGSVLLGVAFLSLPAIGPVLAAGPLLAGIVVSGAGAGATADTDLQQRLGASGMPPSDAERYTRAVRLGGTLVVLSLGEENVEDAAIILARHAPIDPTALREPKQASESGIAPPLPRTAQRFDTSAARPAAHQHSL